MMVPKLNYSMRPNTFDIVMIAVNLYGHLPKMDDYLLPVFIHFSISHAHYITLKLKLLYISVLHIGSRTINACTYIANV